MARAKTKTPDLAALVAKAAKSAPCDAIASAVGKLVSKRLAKPKERSFAGQAGRGDRDGTPAFMDPSTGASKRSHRRSGFAKGSRARAYTKGKANDARPGTFRWTMLHVMHQHSDTRSAELAHADSDSQYKNKKLDFTWAAANGYIIWA